MTTRTVPPFRADHVGSLLRPPALHEARARRKAGEIDDAALKAVEDEAIRGVVALQENVGLQSITDGEFRRTWWHFDFLSGFDGFELGPPLAQGTFTAIDEQPPSARVTGRLARTRPIMVDHFAYLAGLTDRTAKFTLPGPSMVHFRAGQAGIDAAVYPDLDAFWDDLTAAYRAELADLAAAGCAYMQIDDISYAYLCDSRQRERLTSEGEDPDALALVYAQALNAAIRDLPEGVTTAIHLCRGNFQSTFVASGGYEPIAEAVFNTVAADALFLEYDTERAGGFEPLRFMPKDKVVVLGLVTTKTPQLEDKDAVKRRIDEASRYVDLDRLCLSPQCGFASTHHGNKVGEADEVAKLARIVEISEEVWN